MGRGATSTSSVQPLRSSSDGEIASLAESPLAASNIDELTNVAGSAPEEARAPDYGDQATNRAITTLTERLRPKFPHLSDDAFEDLVLDLYNQACNKVASGNASEREIAMLAQLRGEQIKGLSERVAA
jgi:hypothetical protein